MDLQLPSDDDRLLIVVDAIIGVGRADLLGIDFLSEILIDLFDVNLLSNRRIFGFASRFLSDIEIWFGCGLDIFRINDEFLLDHLITIPLGL